jgi:predicted nucleotidyltransferase
VATDDAAVDLAAEIQQAGVAAKGCPDGKDVLGSLRSKPANGHERHADGTDGATTVPLRLQERGARILDSKPVAAGVHTRRQQQQHSKPARLFDGGGGSLTFLPHSRQCFLEQRWSRPTLAIVPIALPTTPAVTHSWSLPEVLAALERAPEIQAVVLLGSTAREPKPWSDFDLLVVLGDSAPPLSSLATRIDGRLADVLFFRPADFTYPDARIAHWVTTGQVVFDRAGVLAHLPPVPEASTPYAEQYRIADHANYNLAQTRRMVTAADPLYQRALDWRFLYQLLDLWQGYFQVRSLVSRGEKEDIRYLAVHDPGWLDLFERCLHEPEHVRRVELYARLIEATFGAVWSGDATAVTLTEPPSGQQELEAALGFWNRLFR